MRTLPYRPDIDGLRAIAVLLVLGYHAGVPLVGGGFIGVDVFFVISGYLITGLLLSEYKAHGNISFWGFWSRRVRRLAPALLFTVGVVLVTAPFLLQRVANQTGPLARAALATLLINANHFFWFESTSYFAPAAEFNPLLHMWSLAVEEQFYLLWPPLMLLVMRKSTGARQWVAVMCTALPSFILALYLTRNAPASAFFLMPARAWELAVGALLVWPGLRSTCTFRPAIGDAAGIAGILLILGSGIWVRGNVGFPAPAALMPVLGSALVLSSGAYTPTNWTSRLLSTRVLVYIGKVSYPLYLWHWPVLVFFRSSRLYEKNLGEDIASLLVSLVFAVLTYELVERRASSILKQISARRVVGLGVAGTFVLIAVAVLLGVWTRFGWGYTEREKFLAAARVDFPSTGCIFAGTMPREDIVNKCFPVTAKASVLLWGDSHAEHWGPALKDASVHVGGNLGIMTFGGCQPVSGIGRTENCQKASEQVFEHLSGWVKDRHLKGIVLSARWPNSIGSQSPAYGELSYDKPSGITSTIQSENPGTAPLPAIKFETDLDEMLLRLKQMGLKVLIVLPTPIQRISGAHCLALRTADQCHISSKDTAAYVKLSEDIIRKITARYPNTQTIDPKEFLCANGQCPVMLGSNVIYRDESHISNSVSKASAPYFIASMKWLIE